MVNAKKAEERQRLEEQLSSAELMHLVAEFGRRIKDLEGRAAEGDRVSGCRAYTCGRHPIIPSYSHVDQGSR